MKKFYLYFALGAGLLIVLYEIWSLPFEFMVQRIILPSAYNTSRLCKSLVSPISFLSELSDLEKRNKNLESENSSQKAEIAKLTSQNQLMQSSKTEAEASKNFDFETLQARIIGQTPYSYDQIYVINKGTNDGLKLGAGVINNGNLIGKIKKIFSNRSEVESILSHDSIVPARLVLSKETGLVQGGLEGMIMTDIPIGAKIQSEDQVVTSGLGGDLPPGILLGQVEQIIGSNGELFQKTTIKPNVTFSDIEVVSVVK